MKILVLSILLVAGLYGSANADQVLLDQVVIEIDGAVPVGNNAEAQVIAMANQLKPHLAVEISFAKRAAELEEDQVKKLVEATREGWMQCAKDAVGGNNQLQGNAIFFGNGRVVRGATNDLYQRLGKVVADTLPKVADADQVAKYKKEFAARDEFRKQATIDEMTAMLDEGLLLDDEQRDKIRQSLVSEWQDAWAGNMEALQQYGEQYYPSLPDKVIVPHLSKIQKSRWDTLQKVNASVGFGNNMFGAQVIADIKIPDPQPPKDAGEEAAAVPNALIRLQQLVPAMQSFSAEAEELIDE